MISPIHQTWFHFVVAKNVPAKQVIVYILQPQVVQLFVDKPVQLVGSSFVPCCKSDLDFPAAIYIRKYFADENGISQ